MDEQKEENALKVTSRANNKKNLQALLAVIVTLGVIVGFDAFAKEPSSKSTQYLYDQCSSAFANDSFKGSFCETYIGAFMDGYSIGGYVMVSEIYKNNIQDKIKRPNDCHPAYPDNIEEFVKLYISWVDEKKVAKKVQYDVLSVDYSESLGAMFLEKIICLDKDTNYYDWSREQINRVTKDRF